MYEDYMQNFMNFPCTGCMQNTYDMNMENYPYTYSNPNNMGYGYMNSRNYGMSAQEMENCYPEIYKVMYPMVKKVCMRQNVPITKELIDDMVQEVCDNLETNDRVELNITVNNDVKKDAMIDNRETENRQAENRAPQRNRSLSDLARILILRELLGRPNFYPGPMPGGPGGPGGPGNRPPMPWQRPPFPR